MTSKATEKIVDALSQLLEGYSELQESLEREYNAGKATDDDDDDDDTEETEVNPEVDAAIVTELKSALESVMESEDYGPEEVAQVVSTMTDALQEIDPGIFEQEEEKIVDDEYVAAGDDDEYDYDDDDDDDIDLDEDDDEEDDDDEDEEDEEEEEEEDDE